MATWHQRQARVRLDHPTEWTVVNDPPNSMRSCMSFTTEDAARAFLAKHPQHSFILPPRKRD